MTQPAGVPLGEMVQQSIKVFTKPSVQTFEEFENRGSMRDALIYVGVGAVIIGILGLFGGVASAIGGIISTILGFFVFVYVVHYVGKAQGATGTLDQVAYTFSLFYIPLQILVAVVGLVLVISLVGILLLPLLPLAALVVGAYLAYLAAQSSLNLTDTTKVVLSLLAGIIASAVVSGIVTNIFHR